MHSVFYFVYLDGLNSELDNETICTHCTCTYTTKRRRGGGIDKEVKKLTTKDDISFLTYTENKSRLISVNKEI